MEGESLELLEKIDAFQSRHVSNAVKPTEVSDI